MKQQKEWAIYFGDEFQFTGTTKECAARLGIKPSTVRFYSTPTYQRRRAMDGEGIFVVDLGKWEDES